MAQSADALLLGGIPGENPAFYHRVRFAVGDPAAWLAFGQFERGDIAAADTTEFIVRDIEQARARDQVSVDRVSCPADYEPEGGLSGDRLIATAQATAECMRRRGVKRIIVDRSLPFVYAAELQAAQIELQFDPNFGVEDRRCKDAKEIEYLKEAQQATEKAMQFACEMVANADADASGQLTRGGELLTSERLQREIAIYLIDMGYSLPHGCIVATRPDSADCHARGGGVLTTGEAVIVDIFPQSNATHYWGDCTRTVVHGTPSDVLKRMHAAVVDAKAAATAVCVAGRSADEVHAATKSKIHEHGFQFRRAEISDDPVMPHGTGHGIGLECHEPILLDDNGGDLLAGEVFTVEPGLYSRNYGGVRVEDMVVVQSDGPPVSLNTLHEGLDWT